MGGATSCTDEDVDACLAGLSRNKARGCDRKEDEQRQARDGCACFGFRQHVAVQLRLLHIDEHLAAVDLPTSSHSLRSTRGKHHIIIVNTNTILLAWLAPISTATATELMHAH